MTASTIDALIGLAILVPIWLVIVAILVWP